MKYTLKECHRGKDRRGHLQTGADSARLGMKPIPNNRLSVNREGLVQLVRRASGSAKRCHDCQCQE